MKYKIFSHNNANLIFSKKSPFSETYIKLIKIIDEISDDDLIHRFQEIGRNSKSISIALSQILEEKLINDGWNNKVDMFDGDFDLNSSGRSKRWTLDFYKDSIALEIAFNHEETSAWNIIKIPLASNPNKYKLKNEVLIGVIICVTNQMRVAGGFDGSVGTFEKYKQYIDVMSNIINTPLLFIGLHTPDNFKILHRKNQNKKIGKVRRTLL